MVERVCARPVPEAGGAAAVLHWASGVAGSAELSVRAPGRHCLQLVGRRPRSRRQRPEWGMAGASGASATGFADQRCDRDDGGFGRAQPAAGPARIRTRRRITVRYACAGAGDPGEPGFGGYRRRRLAAHARGRPPRRVGARRVERAGDRPLHHVVVGSPPRPAPSRDRDRARSGTASPSAPATWAELWCSTRGSASTNPASGCAAADWTPVLPVASLKNGKPQRVEVDGVGLVLCRTGNNGEIAAFGEFCPHLAAPMSDGWVDRGRLVCPWHGSRFDLCSGDVLRGPSAAPLPRYQTRINDGMIELRGDSRHSLPAGKGGAK